MSFLPCKWLLLVPLVLSQHTHPLHFSLYHSASSSSCFFLCPQMSPGVHHLATRCHLPPLTGMQRSLLLIAHSNPYPVAPGIFKDPSLLFLQIIPLPPCCSHWSFTADVKESKLRTVIVFVGGNLVTAFSFSSRQAALCVGAAAACKVLGPRGSVWDGPAHREGGGVFGL